MVHSLVGKFWGGVRLSVVIALWAQGRHTLNGTVEGDAEVHIYHQLVKWQQGGEPPPPEPNGHLDPGRRRNQTYCLLCGVCRT